MLSFLVLPPHFPSLLLPPSITFTTLFHPASPLSLMHPIPVPHYSCSPSLTITILFHHQPPSQPIRSHSSLPHTHRTASSAASLEQQSRSAVFLATSQHCILWWCLFFRSKSDGGFLWLPRVLWLHSNACGCVALSTVHWGSSNHGSHFTPQQKIATY